MNKKPTLKDFLNGIDKVNEVMASIDDTSKILFFTINGTEYGVESSEDFFFEISYATKTKGAEPRTSEEVKSDLVESVEFEEDGPSFEYDGLRILMCRIM